MNSLMPFPLVGPLLIGNRSRMAHLARSRRARLGRRVQKLREVFFPFISDFFSSSFKGARFKEGTVVVVVVIVDDGSLSGDTIFLFSILTVS